MNPTTIIILAALLLASPASAFAPVAFKNRGATKLSYKTLDEDLAAESNKVAIITGSSQGIGRAIALELAKYKNKIVINYIAGFKDQAEEVCKEVEELGSEAIAVEADVSKKADIEKMFQAVYDHYGSCDILVNNAGIARDGLVLRMTQEQWQSVIDLNLSGVFYCSQEFLKRARKQGYGRIVNIASVVGQIGNIGQANYAAAKGGVIAMSRANGKEFAKFGINVNAVCPGFIESAMTKKLGDEKLKEVSGSIPMGRLGKPSDVAGTVRFLALDPAAGYITGHCFDVDGGIAIGCA
jgi:3-oxoacyl-[acyl-carrier protein] reductase